MSPEKPEGIDRDTRFATSFEEQKTVRYRHYKGGLYELVCEATLESDPSVTMVVYRAHNGTIWTRPASVFFEQVEHEGRLVARFALVD
ncbi:DUF1653 domain-containing protein [Paraburkholderia megapolitana]|uniref:DUF1653 domain-containing protein n=1 Tax=Paraburkholderia megapolitana TaxID=420953 RepID=A0A1I3DZH4_9BURK|nr:DUF1653 domain-containing protein [Paraburkholderia megapolitana]SFH92009.1 Protein of unknown function [Paraburkholderia megapolitana]